MKLKKIGSLVFILLLLGGIGYAIYRDSGPIVAEALIIEGQTVRAGGLTQRSTLEKHLNHAFEITALGKYAVYLEGYFPDPARTVHSYNNYTVSAVGTDGILLFEENARIRFDRKKKDDQSKQILSDLKPGLTKKKITNLDLATAQRITVTIQRGQCDTTANELYLRIRERR